MKYKIDAILMDEIDTQEKAYWLGFFYADAYNNEKLGRVVIELQERDKEHLYKCAKFFGQPREPFRQEKNRGKYIAYRLELNSKHLTRTLAGHGCHQTKSFNIKFPHLSQKLIRHFVRGYFDGDGFLHVNKSDNQMNIGMVSTKEMITKISKLLKSIRVNSYISYPERYTGNTCRLDSGGSRQVLRFCNWIYHDATIYLDRKFDLFTAYRKTHVFRFGE